ncbi:hypothetical protein DRH27_00445 [Candidatus Falkowbacteria bacterium]|nr:MAG: hypothetical protein DRH27_00445 [Candidatus Falkowbacteria bacterium]
MKLVIGFITYGDLTAKYLPYFLESLKKQSFKDFKIIAVDNTESAENPNKKYITGKYPEFSLKWMGGNLGFAKANNIIINLGRKHNPEYILLLNPDMILQTDAAEKLVRILDNNRELGSVCPKILQWDFTGNKKTKIIDSCGIKETGALRFVDIGQGEEDLGQYDKAKILGPSGAAAMYRVSAIKKASFIPSPCQGEGQGEVQYFDELMFMYKEDCDLAYRLKLAGYKSKLVSDAIVYHDRTAGGKGKGDMAVAVNRRRKSQQIKKWSFLNQQIIFSKYWSLQSLIGKLSIIVYQKKMILFILFFEQYLLRQFVQLFKIRKSIKKYKKSISSNI